MRESADVGRAVESEEQLRQDLAALQSQVESEVTTIQRGADAACLPLESIVLRPKKSDIQVGQVLLVWTPWQIAADGVAQKVF